MLPSTSLPAPLAGLAPRWRFLLLAGLLYLLWVVGYQGCVLPNGRFDAYLTHNLARTSAGLLRGFGFAAAAPALAPVVTMAGQPAVVVGAPCDGAALYALFTGFVLAFPGSWRPKLWFIPLGVAGLYLLNIGRVAVLALNHYYAHHSVEFNHHYTFTFVVYGCIGWLWMWWVKHYGPATPARP